MYPRYFNKVDKTQSCWPLWLLPTLAHKQKPPWGYSLIGVGACKVQAQSLSLRFHLEASAWWMRSGYHSDGGTVLLGVQTLCLQHYASEGGFRDAEQNIIKKRQT